MTGKQILLLTKKLEKAAPGDEDKPSRPWGYEFDDWKYR